MLFLPLLVAFLVAVLLTPCVRAVAFRAGVLDYPDNNRKTHNRPTPLGGGVAVLVATVLGVVAVWLVHRSLDTQSELSLVDLAPLLGASIVVVVVGLVDDRFSLRCRHKLVWQIVAVGVVIAAGLRIERLEVLRWTIELESLAIPVTLLWLLGTVNSLNLLDGADGFATSIGIVLTGTLAVIAVIVGDGQAAVVACALAGALLGFLVFNFPPSSIFLGDAGSMFIGLVVGVLAIQGHIKGPAVVVLATPVALMAIPILDTSAAFLRRWLTGRKISAGDRRHLQHILLRRGFGPRGVLLCVSLLCSITAVGALASVVWKNQLFAVVSVLAVLWILRANNLFGTGELTLAVSRLNTLFGSFVPGILQRRRKAAFQTRIGRRDSRACRRIWATLREFANRHDLSTIRLDLEEAYGNGETVLWEHRQHTKTIDNWHTRIPMAAKGVGVGQLELTGSVDGEHACELLSDLRNVIESLTPHLEQLVVPAPAVAVAGRQQCPDSTSRVLTFDRAEIVGIKIDFLLQAEVVRAIDHWRQHGLRSYMTLTNPHSLMLCRRDPAMRDATSRAGLSLPDGVGVLLGAKLLGYGRRHRVAGPALMLELCDKGRFLGYRHFFYGGGEGIPQRLAQRLSKQFPGLQVAGTYCPPFRRLTPEEDEQVVDTINASQADIVWVGLGAPKQEKWMADHALCITATAMIGVGAAFDFHTGNVKWAPWIIRKCGMEWAYRLALEPRRMWRRNLDSPLFLGCVGVHVTKRLTRRILGKPSAPRVRSVSWSYHEQLGQETDAEVAQASSQ